MATVSVRPEFAVEKVEAVSIDLPGELANRDLMSPYVWSLPGGRHAMLLRGVPKGGVYDSDTGMVWYGESADGLSFTMREEPVLKPGPDPLDIGGCEDPTLVMNGEQWLVYYTGVDAGHACGQMLYATGTGPGDLAKQGVALASTRTEGNTKEATIGCTREGRWRLFYEYATAGHSLVGLALGDGVAGPWHEQPRPFAPREGMWDDWHLSTGPMWTEDEDMPVMFYNGATHDAHWRIGWIAFDRDYTGVVARCEDPLIAPRPMPELPGVDIAFAASCLRLGPQLCRLYYSIEDRHLLCATVRRLR